VNNSGLLAAKIDNNPETAKYFWTFIKKCQVLRNEQLLTGKKRQVFSNEGAMGPEIFAPSMDDQLPNDHRSGRLRLATSLRLVGIEVRSRQP
jgi:hypothetical protein